MPFSGSKPSAELPYRVLDVKEDLTGEISFDCTWAGSGDLSGDAAARFGLLKGLFSLRMLSYREKAFCWIFPLIGLSVVGRSRIGELEGSYLSLFSLANIGLLATREAFLRFSIEPRFAGTGDTSRSGLFSEPKRAGAVASFSLQNARGERKGDGSNGEESRLTIIFCEFLACAGDDSVILLTLVA